MAAEESVGSKVEERCSSWVVLQLPGQILWPSGERNSSKTRGIKRRSRSESAASYYSPRLRIITDRIVSLHIAALYIFSPLPITPQIFLQLPIAFYHYQPNPIIPHLFLSVLSTSSFPHRSPDLYHFPPRSLIIPHCSIHAPPPTR